MLPRMWITPMLKKEKATLTPTSCIVCRSHTRAERNNASLGPSLLRKVGGNEYGTIPSGNPPRFSWCEMWGEVTSIPLSVFLFGASQQHTKYHYRRGHQQVYQYILYFLFHSQTSTLLEHTSSCLHGLESFSPASHIHNKENGRFDYSSISENSSWVTASLSFITTRRWCSKDLRSVQRNWIQNFSKKLGSKIEEANRSNQSTLGKHLGHRT